MHKIISLCIAADTQPYYIKEYIVIVVMCSTICEDWSRAADRLTKYTESITVGDFTDSAEHTFLRNLIEFISTDNKRMLIDLLVEQRKFFKSKPDIIKIIAKLQQKYTEYDQDTIKNSNNNFSQHLMCNEEDDLT